MGAGLALLPGGAVSSPPSCGSLNLCGVTFAARADYATAQAYFQQAIHQDPGRPEPVWNLALLYFAAGGVAEALELVLFLLDREFKAEPPRGFVALVVATPPRCALPGRRALLWAVTCASMALGEWALALSAVEELDQPPFPRTLSSPFRMGGHVSGIEVRRAHACVLLQLGQAEYALRTCLEVHFVF